MMRMYKKFKALAEIGYMRNLYTELHTDGAYTRVEYLNVMKELDNQEEMINEMYDDKIEMVEI